MRDKKRVTIHDIARELSLTASTVSRALNDHPRISRETKALVKAKATAMDYRPNHLASGLRKGRSSSIGVIVPRINRHFFGQAINGIEQVTFASGFNLLICQSNETREKEAKNLIALQNSQVDGLIISVSAETKDARHLKEFARSDTPVVQFDRVRFGINGHKIINSDEAAAHELVNHLIEQGYQRIAHLGGPDFINIYENRFHGFRSAVEAAGLSLREEWVYRNALTQERGRELAQHLFSREAAHRPDAVFAASDYAALGVLEVLQERNIKVPEEVGVAGYANEPFTTMINPSLTTVEQFGEELGKTAAQLLVEAIQHPKASQITKKIEIQPRVIVRHSTARKKI
ncbi:MAG: LacI family DNA-binding transcriptional regulator [Bacteroidota bacterium]